MLVNSKKLFLSIFFLFATFLLSAQVKRNVVVLSMDGFREEYLERAKTPLLDSLRKIGTYATTYPCFPANTFPNHYSMATGLHPDHHGIVNNTFYDRQTNKTFHIKDSKALKDSAFWLGEPIWNTAERQGVRAYVYHWVGSETKINGQMASHWKKYGYDNWYAKADSVIKWLSMPIEQRPQLIMWYINEPDAVGHAYSPDGKEVIDKIESIDKMLSYFLTKAKNCEAYKNTDFIFLSDHGMAKVTKSINILTILEGTNYDKIFAGVPTFIYAKEENQKEILERLKSVKHIKAYTLDNLPKQYKYGTMKSREADIIVLPETGYFIKSTDAKGEIFGSHGYDPFIEEMRSPFFAIGPDFKRGYKGKMFQNLNIYVLISYLLGINPAPNDGDIKEVENLLKK